MNPKQLKGPLQNCQNEEIFYFLKETNLFIKIQPIIKKNIYNKNSYPKP